MTPKVGTALFLERQEIQSSFLFYIYIYFFKHWEKNSHKLCFGQTGTAAKNHKNIKFALLLVSGIQQLQSYTKINCPISCLKGGSDKSLSKILVHWLVIYPLYGAFHCFSNLGLSNMLTVLACLIAHCSTNESA